MGHNEDREDRRVVEGERIIEAIEEAIRVRVLHPASLRAQSKPYRDAMMALEDAFRTLAQEEISRNEQGAAYDAGRS